MVHGEGGGQKEKMMDKDRDTGVLHPRSLELAGGENTCPSGALVAASAEGKG